MIDSDLILMLLLLEPASQSDIIGFQILFEHQLREAGSRLKCI